MKKKTTHHGFQYEKILKSSNLDDLEIITSIFGHV